MRKEESLYTIENMCSREENVCMFVVLCVCLCMYICTCTLIYIIIIIYMCHSRRAVHKKQANMISIPQSRMKG